MGKILVTEDDEDIATFLQTTLVAAGHTVTIARDGREALEALARHDFDMVLTDLQMPRLSGVELLRQIRSERPELDVVILTAHASVESAVEAMRMGAYDYLQKPVRPDPLKITIARVMEHRELVRFRDRVRQVEPPEPLLTYGAPAMEPVVEALRKVAPTGASVLLLGESGCGKEVAARRLHKLSKRADGPLITVHCAAFAESLLESELFGHEKGAFTGAATARAGRLELARGGTVFLDEIGELKPELQVKLLRVIQERKFERVGGSRTLDVDVRWVAATNADLPAMIQDGQFREDLYHRLAVFPIRIPPLRERREDILPLSRQLLRGIAEELGRPDFTLTADASERLENAPWTGNVRELKNALERAAILAPGATIGLDELWIDNLGGAAPTERSRDLEAVEKETIAAALAEASGNRRKAAEKLGIALRTLYNKLQRYGLR